MNCDVRGSGHVTDRRARDGHVQSDASNSAPFR